MTTMSTPPRQVGRYRLLEEIGRGAMGAVFRAHDPRLDREVAIKVIATAYAEGSGPGGEAEARFLRETRLSARLLHPGIVAVHDAGREGAEFYLVMELVEGESLAHRLARGAFPTPDEALEIVAQAAEALAVAHAAGVIHRDIKPGNLLLTPEGRVKVSDFGIAKAMGESTELTRTGMLVGSPAYMAPEQIKGAGLDGRADLFSLGVVLYELLLRRRPFPADTVTTLVYQILHEDPLSDPAIVASLPPAQARLLQECLAKEPGARIPDARTLAARARAAAGAALPAARPAIAPEIGVGEAPTVLSATSRPVGEATSPTQPMGWPPAPAIAATEGTGTAAGRRLRTGLWGAVVLAALLAGFALAGWFFRSPPQPQVGRPEEVPAPLPTETVELPPPVGTPFSPTDLAMPDAPAGTGSEAPPVASLTPPPPVVVPPARKAPEGSEPPAPATVAPPPAPVPTATRSVEPAAEPTITPPVSPAPPPIFKRYQCRQFAEFHVDPEEAFVVVDGRVIGTSDDWDDAGGGSQWPLEAPGTYLVELRLEKYESVWVVLEADPNAKKKVCRVSVELEKVKKQRSRKR